MDDQLHDLFADAVTEADASVNPQARLSALLSQDRSFERPGLSHRLGSLRLLFAILPMVAAVAVIGFVASRQFNREVPTELVLQPSSASASTIAPGQGAFNADGNTGEFSPDGPAGADATGASQRDGDTNTPAPSTTRSANPGSSSSTGLSSTTAVTGSSTTGGAQSTSPTSSVSTVGTGSSVTVTTRARTTVTVASTGKVTLSSLSTTSPTVTFPTLTLPTVTFPTTGPTVTFPTTTPTVTLPTVPSSLTVPTISLTLPTVPSTDLVSTAPTKVAVKTQTDVGSALSGVVFSDKTGQLAVSTGKGHASFSVRGRCGSVTVTAPSGYVFTGTKSPRLTSDACRLNGSTLKFDGAR